MGKYFYNSFLDSQKDIEQSIFQGEGYSKQNFIVLKINFSEHCKDVGMCVSDREKRKEIRMRNGEKNLGKEKDG